MTVAIHRRVVVSDHVLVEADMDQVDALALALLGPDHRTTLVGTVHDDMWGTVFEPFTAAGAVLVTAVARGDVAKLLEVLRDDPRLPDRGPAGDEG